MSVETERITRERIGAWSKRLSADNSTPLLLLAVGHDHTSGRLTVLVPEGLDRNDIKRLLAYAGRNLP